MAQAYTPGLQVKARTRYRIQRVLPIPGDVLVSEGDQVQALDIVARTQQPGNLYPVNVSNLLSIPPGEVPGAMLQKEGTQVSSGDRLAISKGIFGMFRQVSTAPADGVVESVSDASGQVIIRGAPVPVEVDAFVSGVITKVLPEEGVVVETDAAFLQGIFGVGGEAHGKIHLAVSSPDDDLTADSLDDRCRGAVVVGGRRIHGNAVARALELGATALISGGIDDQDLRDILGYDLGVAVTGSENIGLTIIITEGFGQIAMAARTFELLQSLDGQAASVNGATQIRAGVLRPEIVIPLGTFGEVADVAERAGGGVLAVGAPVRIIRDPWFGELGTVTALPPEPRVLESESKARILEVECQSGKRVIVPRANVEMITE